MSDWLTFKEAGAVLGMNPRNMRNLPGFDQVRTKNGAPYRGKFYHRADIEKLAEYRNSGQLLRDSYAERQAGNRKRATPKTKKKQLSRDGRTVDPVTLRLNRAKIKAQEEAVRAGKLEPKYLGVNE